MTATLLPTDQEISNQLLDMISDPGLQKQAQTAITDFVRMRMREEGFHRRIQPPQTVTNADLDKQADTDKPVIVCEKEPDAPAAVSIPYQGLPYVRYIHGTKFRVMFQRMWTPKMTKDIAELRTYDQDIRQLLCDIILKDLQKKEDGKFIDTVNSLLGGAPGVVNPDTGIAQWQTIAGGITRETFNDGLKILPSTPNSFAADVVLLNHITAIDIQKWGRDEMGGDMAQQIATDGLAATKLFNTSLLISIKKDLVPTNRMYYFAKPERLGKFFILEDVTMWVKTEMTMVEFCASECIGAAIANTASIAAATFTEED